MVSRKQWLVFASLSILLLMIVAFTAIAHEGRELGEYRLVFGWRNEPALVGYPNGPELFISPHSHDDEEEADHEHEEAANPLEGVEISLQVEVSFGPAVRTLDMRPMFGEPDHYIADLIPTRPGDYSFRVFGTIGDMAVDEVFTSADGSFSSVEPAGDVTFPDELPSVVVLMQQIAVLESRIAELEGGE